MSEAPSRRRRLLALVPWLVAATFLAVLVARVGPAALAAAVARGPWGAQVVLVAVQVPILFAIDVWATRIALAAGGLALPWRQVRRLRAASYLLSILGPAATQGGTGALLARTGGVAAGAGAALLLLVTQALAVVTVAAAATLLRPPPAGWGLPLLLVAGGAALYLVVLAVARSGIARLRIVAPLAGAGPGGHLRATAARAVHVAGAVLASYAALRLWGVALPWDEGFGRIPLLYLVAAVPITPSGLGPVQALQIAWFGGWAPGSDEATRAAGILALGLLHHVLAVAGQLVVGALGLRALASDRRRGEFRSGHATAAAGSGPEGIAD